ncbi:BglG family transcription antiterminator [Staphylococcus canis]|uniref:BglG family transcription antiterminator n=1 Tax=Staphylococcus canis TaxID=2724942 RepID=A0ABS0TAX6_9STAP|nr:BglG family transcription antiterminator [Staphylococcus canis]MBI5975899.1 BglG family transcription antiterminator [Staphylococcus canis]
MYLKHREKQIIDMLLKNQDVPIRIYDIAQHLGISSRTVHRELKSIEKSLLSLGISILREKNKGISIQGSPSSVAELKQLISTNTPIDLTIEEQKVILLYALIQANEPLKQLGLASEIGTSLQQLSKILDALEKDLEQFQIELVRKRGSGIAIQGSEMHKRELLSQLMMDRLNSQSVYSVIENHFVFQSLTHERLPMMDIKEIFQIERLLMDDLDALPYLLTESSYLNLIIHIALSVDRMRKKQYVSIDQDIVNNTKDSQEFKVAQSIAHHLSELYHIEFDIAEITFITIHLQGSKRKQENSTDMSLDIDHSIKQLVHQVEQLLEVTFENQADLIEGLKLHIRPALNRIQFNIETYNPMTENVQLQYPELFRAIDQSVQSIWPMYTFSNHEIAFLVLHFGSVTTHQHHRKSVLVVCSSGVGTSRILSNRLYEDFSYIDAIKQVSVSDLNALSLNDYDAIISTVDLDIESPYLTVNPLLPDYDVKRTHAFLQNQFSNDKKRTQTQKSDDKGSSFDIEQKIQVIRESIQILDEFQIYEMSFIEKWSTEIAKLLSQHHVIKTENIAQMIEVLVNKHQYQSFVLESYPIAIPHLVDDVIEKPTILIVLLENPININSKGPVSTLICAFLPTNSLLKPLVSHIYSEIALKLDDLAFLSDRKQLNQFIKSQIINFNQSL